MVSDRWQSRCSPLWLLSSLRYISLGNSIASICLFLLYFKAESCKNTVATCCFILFVQQINLNIKFFFALCGAQGILELIILRNKQTEEACRGSHSNQLYKYHFVFAQSAVLDMNRHCITVSDIICRHTDIQSSCYFISATCQVELEVELDILTTQRTNNSTRFC